ncbi:MAG: metallophosphatase family protein [Deltaproteobacteria bacterium]|nr:metallophosphatase family protein [Candidatus Deferrimicrobium borealis]
MRIALVSDLHANLEALKSLDRALSALSPERVYHLGDLVGFGAHPEECVRWAISNTRGGVLGNHDAVALNLLGREASAPAYNAARWAKERLSAAARKYLSLLPMRELVLRSRLLLVHGAPSDPFRRIFGEEDADAELDIFPEATTVAVGHSHVPQAVVRSRGGNTVLFQKGSRTVRGVSRLLVNPGSVGAPRDRKDSASFLIFDDQRFSFSWYRVPYDGRSSLEAIRDVGIPAPPGPDYPPVIERVLRAIGKWKGVILSV